MKYSKENKTNRGISKGTCTQEQSIRWHFSFNERIGENCETKTDDSAVKDHKSNARARMGKTREDLGTNYLLSSGKTEERIPKLVFLGPIFFSSLTQFVKVWLNSARELSKSTTCMAISLYSKAFFFSNFEGWLWLILDGRFFQFWLRDSAP